MKRRVPGFALTLALVASLGAAPALACGYHQPVDLERGILNLVYPNALYVPTAVWQAQQSGLLGPADAMQASDPFAFHGVARRLETLGETLAGKAPEELSGFSLVLIDSMLWTRYTLAYGKALSVVHSDGAGLGDTVVVTHELVVRALVEGDLDGERALALGLIRLYGSDAKLQALAKLFAAVTAGAF
jgi:hypothetical protein